MAADVRPRTRGVRWNPRAIDALGNLGAFELWCPACAKAGQGPTFWPLDSTFWIKGNLQQCRACTRAKRAAYQRERDRTDERVQQQRRDHRREQVVIYNQRARARAKARAVARADRRAGEGPGDTGGEEGRESDGGQARGPASLAAAG